ncbi:MAG: hypothetical protein EBU84_13655 [Actinobacteria bacterium]|nr:hypothetical protein [Actinomycetota bacterium]
MRALYNTVFDEVKHCFNVTIFTVQMTDQALLGVVNIGMKTTTRNLIDGLESSRRVGWAKYYALKEENEHLKWLLRLLVRKIIFHGRLHGDDALVTLAKEIERSDW